MLVSMNTAAEPAQIFNFYRFGGMRPLSEITASPEDDHT